MVQVTLTVSADLSDQGLLLKIRGVGKSYYLLPLLSCCSPGICCLLRPKTGHGDTFALTRCGLISGAGRKRQGGRGCGVCWLEDFCTFKWATAFCGSWPAPKSCSAGSLPHQAACPVERDALEEHGRASPTVWYVQAGLGLSCHYQHPKAADVTPLSCSCTL